MKNDELSTIEGQIKALDEQIKEARNTKWKGTTTSKSQETITALNKQKLALQKEKNRISNRIDSKNDQIESSHEFDVQLNAKQFALLTLFFELLFLICSWYLEYYDYRSFTEFATPVDSVATNEIKKESPKIIESEKESVATGNGNGASRGIIEAAIKNAKSNLDAYRNKLRKGEGVVATNKNGIKKWQEKIEELEKMLPT